MHLKGGEVLKNTKLRKPQKVPSRAWRTAEVANHKRKKRDTTQKVEREMWKCRGMKGMSGDERERESVCEMSCCVLVSVRDLITLDCVCDAAEPSVSRKRSTGIALEWEQHMNAKASMQVPCVQKDAIQSGARERQEQGATGSRGSTAAKQARMARTTVGSAARSGRHTAERPHLPRYDRSGTEVSAGRVWCEPLVVSKKVRHHQRDGRLPWTKRRTS